MPPATDSTLRIAGAGPAGLSAALTAARAGTHVIVSERHPDVGGRFHGDFQGLENWTMRQDVLDELSTFGIAPTFEAAPFRECVVLDPAGRAYTCRATEPLWYLVRRGGGAGTVDSALKAQALAAGVELRFGEAVEHLPEGGIVAHGPRRADAIAVGYVFETDTADGAWAAISDELAPGGYAYLLLCGGRGTIATCLFDDFHHEARYLERTVEFFRQHVGLSWRGARHFGGFGNVFAERTARKGSLLYAGEAAGFQDALFGFGMRSALVSGHLAALAWVEGLPDRYDAMWRDRLGLTLRLGMVNRYLYERLGDRGYERLLRRIDRARDARDFLRRWYTTGPFRQWLFPLARRRLAVHRKALLAACPAGCDCTWCRCEPHRQHPSSSRGTTLQTAGQ